MSELGSLYIKLGEPEGELCWCTCEVGDWAAKHIVDLTEQRDKLLAAMVELVDDLEARAIDGVVPCGRSAYAKAKSALTGEPMLEYF